jgi:hypothetical protein
MFFWTGAIIFVLYGIVALLIAFKEQHGFFFAGERSCLLMAMGGGSEVKAFREPPHHVDRPGASVPTAATF